VPPIVADEADYASQVACPACKNEFENWRHVKVQMKGLYSHYKPHYGYSYGYGY
jgi:hypothetical protein